MFIANYNNLVGENESVAIIKRQIGCVMLENVIFRYLTPVFRQGDFINFEHSGRYKDATFLISLKGYGTDPSPNILPREDLKELFKYGTESTFRNLCNINRSERFFPPLTNVVLVIDVIQPLTPERKVAVNTRESSTVFNSATTALRLHASKGLAYEYSYLFRFPDVHAGTVDELPEIIKELAKNSPGCSILRPHTIPVFFSPLGNSLSVLSNDQHDSCRSTIQILLEKEWDNTNTFDKVLQLAIEYHKTSLTLENIEHAFLVLMVVFEALFKKESERNASRAANRIAKLLAIKRSDFRQIKRYFFDHPTFAFSKIRNNIAHGNPNLDNSIVKEYLPKLYGYITDAIIALLRLSDDTLNGDYYDDLNMYVERRFDVLPPS